LSFIPPWMLMFFSASFFLISPRAIGIKTLGEPNSSCVFLTLQITLLTVHSLSRLLEYKFRSSKSSNKGWHEKKKSSSLYTTPSYSPLLWTLDEVPPKFNFLFCNEPIWLTHHSNKKNTMEAPQNRNSTAKIGCHYFWPGQIALPKNILKVGYLFCFILISWGCLRSPTLFLQWANLIGPSQFFFWNYGGFPK
jgi:hypothetical protein